MICVQFSSWKPVDWHYSLSARLHVCLYAFLLNACQLVYLSACLYVCLSACLPFYLSACKSASLPVCISAALVGSFFLSFFFCLPIYSTSSTLLLITENYVTYFFSNKYEFILLFFALLLSSFLLFCVNKRGTYPNVPRPYKSKSFYSPPLYTKPAFFLGIFLLPSKCKLKNVQNMRRNSSKTCRVTVNSNTVKIIGILLEMNISLYLT